jgi:hypothetical protein
MAKKSINVTINDILYLLVENNKKQFLRLEFIRRKDMPFNASLLLRLESKDHTLTEIYIKTFPPINDDDIESLVEAAKDNGYLKKLYLPDGQITEKGAKLIANNLHSLEEINLNANVINNEGAKALLGMPNLKKLSLIENEISQELENAISSELSNRVVLHLYDANLTKISASKKDVEFKAEECVASVMAICNGFSTTDKAVFLRLISQKITVMEKEMPKAQPTSPTFKA